MSDAAEPVRLVIWDLDETFWSGTLTEGGITYRRDVHDIVVALAQRGIVSSICSKNDLGAVRDILQREGIWDYFLFPSVDWEPKGPRLAGIVASIQLRPETVLLIDDNPLNRAEAKHFVPGIRTTDESVTATLLDDPLFAGKDDTGLSRLEQYRLLEQRQERAVDAGGDTTAFLRASRIRVSIEHDLEPHLDRAIELINRTNQLNFIKQRLPEDIEAARAELRALIAGFSMQAGILRVRDNYGDYGYCGLYIMRSGAAGLRLLQFCFSCRILNMGVETWLYEHLGRPALRVQGDVLSDVLNDHRTIDWITVELPEARAVASPDATPLDYVFARGGCDLHAVTHYFNTLASNVYREFNITRGSANMRFDHSVFARYALDGLPGDARAAFAKLGYEDADFTSALTTLPLDATGVWILSFWADADFALYRHRATGLSVPLSLPGVQTNQRDVTMLDAEAPEHAAVADTLRLLQSDFDFLGMIDEKSFKDNARLIMAGATADVLVFVLQANDLIKDETGRMIVPPRKRRLNNWVRDVAVEFHNVELVNIRDFVEADPEIITDNHFDRMVYFRVFQHIMRRVRDQNPLRGGAAAA